MKNLLLLALSFFTMLFTAVAQSTATFDFTAGSSLSPAQTPSTEASNGVSVSGVQFTNNGVSFVATKGTNDAVLFTKTDATTELRAYKTATLTVTAPTGKNVTSIVFAGQNQKNMTSDVETYATTGTWTGSSNAVVFTLTGTVKFTTVTVTFDGDGSSVDPVTPTTPTDSTGTTTPTDSVATNTAKTLYSETFASGQGDFTLDNKTLPEATNYIWKADTSYGYMKATAYVNKTNCASEAWLVSPVIDLTKGTKLSLAFDHAHKFGDATKMADEDKLYVREENGEWEQVAITSWPTGSDWTFVTSTQDISKFDGKRIQVAFAYTSTTDYAGTWEVKNLVISGEGEAAEEEKTVKAYNTLAEMAAEASSNKVECTLKADGLLVTGVGVRKSYYSVYVTDGTTSAILYGKNAPICKKGDKLSGTLSGNSCLYQSAVELESIDYTAATVESSDNTVTPELVTIATLGNDTKAEYQSRYVRLEGVNFDAEALSSSNINVIDGDDNTIVLRDNFSVLTDFVFSTTKAYNINAHVAFYNGTAQLYVCSADEVQIISDQKSAETAWSTDTVVVLKGAQFTAPTLSSLSDGKKTFTSSDETVATVSADGVISYVGYGHAVISVETEETDNYLASKASCDLFFIEGKGTLEDAFTAADVQYFNGRVSDKVWVKGTVIGYISDTSKGGYSPADDNVSASNLALGTEKTYVSVQLSSKTAARTALNLKDNASVQGTTVWVYGNLATYCGIAGVKNVTNFSKDGVTGIDAATVVNTDAQTIYSLDGRRLQKPVKGLNIINGKKVILK